MNRPSTATLLIVSFTVLLPGVGRAQDAVHYLDPKTMKEFTATGLIQEESPSKVSYKSQTAGMKEISALDIVDIVYDVPGSIKLIYRSALAEEKKASDPGTKDGDSQKSLAEAIRGFQEMLPRLSAEQFRFAERHVRFKIARLLSRMAESDPTQVDDAIKALQAFKKQHPDGWQIVPCAKLLARLQQAKGDAEAARQTYEELAAIAGVPASVRQDCSFLAADALIEGRKYAEADKKLQGLLQGMSTDESPAIKVRIYLARCLAGTGKLPEATRQLDNIIAGTPDKTIKAMAYNALGDCYRSQDRSNDALWPYLWVDVIYHQDREEHLKAMEHLARLFEEQGNPARSKDYRDKVKRASR